MRVYFKMSGLLAGLFFVPCLVNAQVVMTSGHLPRVSMAYNEALNTDEISYHTSGAEFKVSDDPSGVYCRLIIPEHHFTSIPGQPELPVFSRIIEVPERQSVTVRISEVRSITLNMSDHQMKSRQIYPSQPARTKNESPDERVVVKDKKIYRQKYYLPHDTVIISKVGKFRGKELLNIAVYPAFYNPVKGSVSLITDMKIDIHYENVSSEKKAVEAGLSIPSEADSKAYITSYTDRPISMIILTDSVFLNVLRPFIKWKTMKGIRITTLFRGVGTADEVYSMLKDSLNAIYYDGLSSGYPPEYLMIVGDPVIIPTARGTTNVSDLYYGEFDGEGDYVPDMYIGRIPVSDTSELKAVINKIIGYENLYYGSSNNFWSRSLVTAGNDAGYAAYMNGQVNYLHSNYLSQDATLRSFRWLYPQSPLKDDSLKILINDGISILNYTGHGEAAGFADPSLKVSGIKSLTNKDKYPVIIANACRTAQINAPSCFGKEIVCTPDTGAIGYIGCTNDSYWTEDFYWAVGVGTPNMTATYDNTGPGAFDRLFHTHGEEPGEWMYTLGQINFAGNMSVSSSTSSWKKYYWETYMVIGDPSLTPFIGKPDTFDISLPDTLPQTLEELIFFAKPFSYAGLTDFDTLWDAKFVSPSGNISLKVPPGIKDSCLLVITGQNMVPFRKTIYFGQINSEFLTISSIINDDTQGNNNNLLDYGEKINLKVTVKNLGLGEATNVTATLTDTSGLLSIEKGSKTVSSVAGETSFTIDNDFIFNVADDVDDGDLASMTLFLSDDGHEYSFGIDNIIHAPALKVISSVPNDIYTGNGNYLPEPGEDIRVDVRVSNTGSSSTSGLLLLTETSPLITVGNESIPTGTLNAGEEKMISFTANISSAAASGSVIPYRIDLTCGKYAASGSYSLSAGKTRETWEHTRFDVFPWVQPQKYPWTITSSLAYENTWSARSAVMPDNSESILSITVNNPEKDTISFYSRVSSELTFDYFIFRIDSTEIFKVSGEIPWTRSRALLNAGIHFIEWVYKKDYSKAEGFDASWIDMITFPDISFLEADLKIDTVYAPADTALLNNIIIRGRVINLGRNTLTSFPLSYSINDGEAVKETFFRKVDPGDTLEVSFAQHCIFQPDIEYRITINSCLPEDSYQKNDQASNTFMRESIPDDGPLKIGPVPVLEQMNIVYEALGNSDILIDIVDVSGRVVMRLVRNVTEGENYLDPVYCPDLPSGIYVVRVKEGSRVAKKKIVKN